jgi:hypothetical protein
MFANNPTKCRSGSLFLLRPEAKLKASPEFARWALRPIMEKT